VTVLNAVFGFLAAIDPYFFAQVVGIVGLLETVLDIDKNPQPQKGQE
jgi:hypothetical protein